VESYHHQDGNGTQPFNVCSETITSRRVAGRLHPAILVFASLRNISTKVVRTCTIQSTYSAFHTAECRQGQQPDWPELADVGLVWTIQSEITTTTASIVAPIEVGMPLVKLRMKFITPIPRALDRGICGALLALLLGTTWGCVGSNNTTSGSASRVPAVVVFGDSLTCGGSGNYYGQSPTGSVPTSLQSILNAPVLNQGVGGNTSSQIAVRYNAGGSNQVVTLANNQIPTSGSVAVTFPSGWEPVTSGGGNNGAGCYQSLTGRGTNGVIAGVSGTFTYTDSGYMFTPTVYPRSPVPTGVNEPYTVSSPYANAFLVVTSGPNDFRYGIPSTAALIANNTAMTSLASERYIVTSTLPYIYQDYWTGGADAAAVTSINAAKASAFGNHYVDTLTPLLGGCQPVPGSTIATLDSIDVGHGIVPTSCRSYDAWQLTQNLTPTQTSFCVSDATIHPGMVGYLSHTAAPTGNPEAIQVTAIATPGNCASGSQVTVIRGYAQTIPGTYAALKDSWGLWSDIHLSGGTPNLQLASKTGYTVQSEAIATAYLKLNGK
jgi:hypothetical protein